MRGTDDKQASLFSIVSAERRVAADHPLRRINAMADEILGGLTKTFDAMYSRVGRPSIAPERLLESQILIALYSVRSDRQPAVSLVPGHERRRADVRRQLVLA